MTVACSSESRQLLFLRDELHRCLAQLPRFEHCALLDYPDHLNAGDHFIWLASVLYLELVHGTSISYSASLVDFREEEMKRRIGRAPIFLQGGGNLGDLWPESQLFRERIITTYRDRPIVILPQTIHFRLEQNLARAANIFNSHPDLTIFVRDSESYAIASQYFNRCSSILAPDMVAHLAGLPRPGYKAVNNEAVLFLCRQDAELNDDFVPSDLGTAAIVREDWPTYSWAYAGRGRLRSYNEWYWRLPGAVDLFREGWQRGLSQPATFLSRQSWMLMQPYAEIGKRMHRGDQWRFSWAILHDCLCQLMRYRLVITNRLHGHLASELLGLKNLLMPNSYHKNTSFAATWHQHLSPAKLVTEPAQLRLLIDNACAQRS